jgi:hypothetical protein
MRSAVTLLAAILTVGCVAHHRLTPTAPPVLDLVITVAPSEARVAEKVTVRWTLTSDEPDTVDVCISEISVVFFASDFTNEGVVTIPGHGCIEYFRLAPQSTRVWETTVEVPDITPGPGEVHASAGLLTAHPVPFVIAE